VRVTSARIALVRQQNGYALTVFMRPRQRPGLTAVTRLAAGHLLAFIVAGEVWEIARVRDGPLTAGLFAIAPLTREQGRRLLRA